MRSALGMLTALTLFGVTPAQDPPPPDDAAKKALEALQGTWELDQLELAGKKATDDVKNIIAAVVIDGTTITFRSSLANAKDGRKGTFTIDPAQKPAWFDMVDDYKAKEQGIYEVKDDVFKLCVARPGGERPKEFASKAMPESHLFTFKRAKK